jgi:hypothetical protein
MTQPGKSPGTQPQPGTPSPGDPRPDGPDQPSDPSLTDPDEGGTTEPEGGEGEQQLGETGEKLLAELRAKSRRDDKAKAQAKARIKELEEAAASTAKKNGEAPDPEELRKQLKAEAQAEVLRERALDKAEVMAASAGFAKPEDARLFLASEAADYIADGALDTDAIKDAVTELAKLRPYLLAGKPQRFQGGAEHGPRGGLEKSLDQQIAEARSAGNIGGAIALEMQKLTTANAKT